MNIRKGFSLIEVLIVIALVSMLITALFSSFMAGNRITIELEDEMDIYEALITIERQFARDIAGAFIPLQAESPQKKEGSAVASSSGETKQPAPAPPSKKKPLSEPFVAKNQQESFQLFSCISDNPMRVYWSESSGKPIPSVVRVVYTLVQEPGVEQGKLRYALYRQEDKNLDLEVYTRKDSPIDRYALATNIKSCSLEFVVELEKEQEKGKKAQPPEIEIHRFNDWTGFDEKDARAKAKLPVRVIMRITLWDAAQEMMRDFTLTYPVAAKYSKPKESAAASSSGGTGPANKSAPGGPPKPAGAKPPQKPAGKPSGGPAAGPKVAQRTKNEQILTGAQSIVDGLQAMFGGPRAMS